MWDLKDQLDSRDPRDQMVHQAQWVVKEIWVCRDRSDFPAILASQDVMVNLDHKVFPESLVREAPMVHQVYQERKDMMVLRDLPERREILVTLALQVSRDLKDLQDLQDHPECLDEMVNVDLLVQLDFQDNKVQMDHQDQLALKDLPDPLVPLDCRELLETPVRQDLKETRDQEDNQVLMVQMANLDNREHLVMMDVMV